MRSVPALLIASLITFPAVAGGAKPAVARRLVDAEAVLKASATAPDKGIPKDLLEKAECIGVFPGVKKGAFVIGGEYGHGVFTCREKDGTMGPPAFFTMGGGSFGWQFGGQEADLVLLVMNDDGIKHLLSDKFTVGAEASAAAGPVGRSAEAATDAQLHAQILSWSRSRGLFLGASLAGTVIKPDVRSIDAFYDAPIAAREILTRPPASVPREAEAFMKTTDTYARHS
jgi:lipid-binding SYLF domain-containing protein